MRKMFFTFASDVFNHVIQQVKNTFLCFTVSYTPCIIQNNVVYLYRSIRVRPRPECKTRRVCI